MKIYISADMEGISGVVHREQLVSGTSDYERARKLMTQEVNSAIEGALEAGATEILVNDGHGSMRNIIIEDLNPEARLVTGYPKPMVMMEGIDSSYDGAIFIGYHNLAGGKGVLAHTMSGFTFKYIKINGVEFGETELNGALAGYFGVPVLAVSGDNYLYEEVSKFFQDVEYAEVKKVCGTYAADCLHPEKARKLIKEKVKSAILNKKKSKPFTIEGPIELEVALNKPAFADIVSMIPGAVRISSEIITYKADNIYETLKMITTMMNASSIFMTDIYK